MILSGKDLRGYDFMVHKSKKIFKTAGEYFDYTDDIADAFYDEDLKKMNKLMGSKCKTLEEAEGYFTDIWKKKTKILSQKGMREV
jgi:hypothetical protein